MPNRLIDEDGLEGSPWYVRAFVRVGMPTAFASMLLWFLITNITGTLASHGDQLMQVLETQTTVVSNQAKIIELLMQHAQDEMTSRNLLLAMCYNTSSTDAQRERCTAAFQ